MEFSNKLANNLNEEHGKIVDLQNKIMEEVPGEKTEDIFEGLIKSMQVSSSKPNPCCEGKIPWNGKLLFKDEGTECWYHKISEKSSQTVNVEDRSVFYLILDGSMKFSKNEISKTVKSMGSVSVDPGEKHVVHCGSDCKALVIYENTGK
jgi:mannose-6-phosphate isomerase-like protein (cupin superfamily)